MIFSDVFFSSDFMFHVMIENGIIYLCATDPECSKLTAYGFLNEVSGSSLSLSLSVCVCVCMYVSCSSLSPLSIL